MEENLITQIKMYLDTKNPDTRIEVKKLFAKEYIHAYILDFLYNSKNYHTINFYGGTCLRYVYGLDRLSEDLDFDATSINNFDGFETDIIKYFKQILGYEGLDVKRQMGEKGIRRFTVKLPILYQLGLSTMENERLFIKVEFSNHKQQADIEKKPLFLHGRSFVVSHFSLPSLFAGKILACLERNFRKGSEDVFVKGRDFYDLIWYMQKGVTPKEEKLLKDGDSSYTTEQAFEALTKKINTLRPNDIYIDIVNLLENKVYAERWAESFKEQYFRLVANY